MMRMRRMMMIIIIITNKTTKHLHMYIILPSETIIAFLRVCMLTLYRSKDEIGFPEQQ